LLEIVEHLDDVKAFLETAESILKPGGIMIISTINRTIKSMIMAKIGAEYILHIVPTGTHDWNKFCKPEELVEQTRLQVVNMRGMEFSLRRGGSWVLSDNMDVNYFITLRKL
jgi:2-polyprenyl-6-hydroxyphenyl methylase/3-demethylubiquinone-9 3-methyltransferase